MPNSRVSEQGDHPIQEQEPEAQEQPQASEQDELRAEVARLDDRYKRALADLDNYRKRSAQELERRVAERADALVREWLEAVDSVERALLMAEPDSSLQVGLSAVLRQMEATLERLGVTRIGAVGEQFDPERHEAVGVVTNDEVPDRTIVEIARSGYAVGDRVLRPAQVVVARRGEREA
jgi:molecular chaperone GrpE